MKQFNSHHLKELAIAEGFHKVAIVPATSLDREELLLREWLNRGYHGEMKWLERDPDKRTHPDKLLPGARSVVVVALNYYTPSEHQDDPQTGKVSRYAWGDDYHNVISDKLDSVLRRAKQLEPELEGKVCVDIQPIMDKAWAVRAGIGWLGKHSNVITTEYGSWVFIGELLLNVELEYDNVLVDDHCGTCTLCIDACPTRAIVEPYVVDSTKCISYATIELRGPELPSLVSENLSGWFYGCDICQDVCPWNRFEQTTSEDRFKARPGNVNQSLAQIMSLSQEEYAEAFRGSAMKRAKLVGLQRNARALLEKS